MIYLCRFRTDAEPLVIEAADEGELHDYLVELGLGGERCLVRELPGVDAGVMYRGRAHGMGGPYGYEED